MRNGHTFLSLNLPLFTGLVLLAPGAGAVESRIDAVTVYSAGATVTRAARVDLSAGENSLDFTGITAELDENRLQIEIDGDGVEMGQVRVDRVVELDAYNAAVRALQDDIDDVEARIAGLEDSSKTANLKLKFLEGIAEGYAKESWFEGARGTADVSSWRAALSVLDEGSAAARATLRANAVAVRDAQQALSKLQREMQQLRGQRRGSTTVNVTLRAARAQQANVKLHYFLRSAGWSPQYVAYLDSDSRGLRLAQNALVRQTTDEPWTAARLLLSTSEPTAQLQAPELDPQFLDLQDPAVFGVAPAAPRAAMKADAALEEIAVTASRVRAPPDVGKYAVTYEVPGRVDVPNTDDEAQTFELTAQQFDTRLVTRVVPLVNAQAFLTARFTYDQSLPLYASNMRVYVDQVYVGETWFPTALPGDEVTLPMGQDRRVEVLVRPQGGKKGESGFIGRRKQELTSNLFEITNRRDTATLVEVFDRYPTAVNEDIEVRVPREATPPTQRDFEDQPGIVVWRKSLAAGETWRISHRYEVSYPADKTLISGAPR